MNANKRVSPRAKALMEGFKSGDIHSSILLIGQRGFPMIEDAHYMASFLLDTEAEQLSNHPDYRFYSRNEDEKTIGVEVSDEIVARSRILPSVASRIVFVIDEINTMTVQAQNKLLKLLEEGRGVVVIGVAYEDTLLPTVKSRMQVVKYQPLAFEAYKKQLFTNEKGVDPLVWYYATGGMPGITADAEIAQVFTDVKAAFCSGRPFLAFKAFHMVKEKDENAFFAHHREYVSAALAFMGAVLTALYEADTANTRYDDSISLLAEHQNYCNTLAYTKDSFFSCVARVVETIGKRD